MSLFICFVVNIGNLGNLSGPRQEMREWTREMNRKLKSQNSSTNIVGWYGHTGNFVIESSRTEKSDIVNDLRSVIGGWLALLAYREVEDYVSVAENEKETSPLPRKRWTCGIVFAVNSRPCQTVPGQTSHAAFFALSDHAVGAWKKDQLTENGILDREQRGGGWGAVSGDVSNAVGGTWTARSLRTVKGTLKKAERTLQGAS